MDRARVCLDPGQSWGWAAAVPVRRWLCTPWAHLVTRGVFAGVEGGHSPALAGERVARWLQGQQTCGREEPPRLCPGLYSQAAARPSDQRKCGLEVPKVGVAFQGPELWSPGPPFPALESGSPPSTTHSSLLFGVGHQKVTVTMLSGPFQDIGGPWPPSGVFHRGSGKPVPRGVTCLNPCLVQIPPREPSSPWCRPLLPRAGECGSGLPSRVDSGGSRFLFRVLWPQGREPLPRVSNVPVPSRHLGQHSWLPSCLPSLSC